MGERIALAARIESLMMEYGFLFFGVSWALQLFLAFGWGCDGVGIQVQH